MSKLVVALVGAAIALTALAREPSFREFAAVQESLRHLPPNMRFYELERRGFRNRQADVPLSDSVELRMAGKWGAGPSVKVTGRDSLVFLSRGSEVVAIDFSDTANSRVLSHIQVMGVVSRSVLVGNRLYVGSTDSDPKYIDAFDVSDAANPMRLGSVRTHLYDIDAHDSLVYAIDKESLKVFSFADPAHPRMVGACRDSGYDISVCNGYAYLGDRWGLYVVDVTNPTNPHRIGSWGTDIISVKARGSICCATTDSPSNPGVLRFTVLDVRAPSSPTPVGSLDSCGAYDVHLDGQFAFLSGYYIFNEFRILDISDSTRPHHIGTVATPDQNFGVWANPTEDRAYVADCLGGLIVIGTANLNAPVVRDTLLRAGIAYGVCVQAGFAYVADDGVGLKVLDATVPSLLHEVGSLDSTRDMVAQSVAVADSFAYMSWGPSRPWLRSISISDPTRLVKAGGVGTFDYPAGLVVRDTLLYVAQPYRFQIVSIARPRQPFLVGSCVIQDAGADFVLKDSLAYVAAMYLTIINVSKPDSPRVISSGLSAVSGLDVVDTIAYLAFDGLRTASVANPAAPYLLDSVSVTDFITDVAVMDTLAVLSGRKLYVFSVADPRNIRLLGTWTAPGWAYRLLCEPPYIYAACWDGGVCILETTQTGISEPAAPRGRASPVVLPSVTASSVRVVLPEGGCAGGLKLFDATGKEVMRVISAGPGGPETGLVQTVDLAGLPVGVYVLRGRVGGETMTAKVIKTSRR